MKKGIDISHYQKITDWNKVKADFIIQKCTEGTTYKDPTYEKNRDEITKKCVFGAYHFARGGDVIKEAEWFLKGLGGTSREGDILVLDWEIEHPNPTGWCKDFLDIIKLKTGLTPYLYTNEARANKIENSYPWWIARYGTNDGTIQKEPTKPWTIFQYTSRGKVEGIEGYVDLNIMKESEVNNMQIENQLDKKWARWYLGTVKTSSFKNYGCFLFCLTYMYSVKQGEQISPTMVDKLFMANGVYNGDLINSEKAAKVLGLKYSGKEYDINKPPNWSPSIKEVDYSIAGGKQQHFTVRINDSTGRYILDPIGGVKRIINYYEKKVGAPNWETGHFSYRKFKV